MTDRRRRRRRRRPKVVPRAAADFVRQLKIVFQFQIPTIIFISIVKVDVIVLLSVLAKT